MPALSHDARLLRNIDDCTSRRMFIVGIFGVLLAIILMILNYLRPADMNKFFGTHSEILSPYDEEVRLIS